MCEALPPTLKRKLHENMVTHRSVFMFGLQSGMVVRASLSRFFLSAVRRKSEVFTVLGSFLVPGGVPGASWGTLWGQVGLQVAFSTVFGGLGEALGPLLGSFGGALGALGPTLAPKVGSKVRKRPVLVHIGSLIWFLL